MDARGIRSRPPALRGRRRRHLAVGRPDRPAARRPAAGTGARLHALRAVRRGAAPVALPRRRARWTGALRAAPPERAPRPLHARAHRALRRCRRGPLRAGPGLPPAPRVDRGQFRADPLHHQGPGPGPAPGAGRRLAGHRRSRRPGALPAGDGRAGVDALCLPRRRRGAPGPGGRPHRHAAPLEQRRARPLRRRRSAWRRRGRPRWRRERRRDEPPRHDHPGLERARPGRARSSGSSWCCRWW